MDIINITAPAKINLGLDVLRRREDGYHDVRMIMQTVRLYDKITIRKESGTGIFLHTNLVYLPNNENNLVFKAVKLLVDEFQISNRLCIQLEKHIPVAAGMAGGSTDAAAALIAMNQLFELNLSQEDLMKRGLTLGADIPYCIMKGTALSEGIGEILTPLPPTPDCIVLIAKPNIHVSTKSVYEGLRITHQTPHPDIDGMIQSLHDHNLTALASSMENVLESVTIHNYPEIAQLKQLMLNNGALGSLMSGSGPTVFGLFNNKTAAETAFQLCKLHNPQNRVFLTKFYMSDKEFGMSC